jgi:hypothetical protein
VYKPRDAVRDKSEAMFLMRLSKDRRQVPGKSDYRTTGRMAHPFLGAESSSRFINAVCRSREKSTAKRISTSPLYLTRFPTTCKQDARRKTKKSTPLPSTPLPPKSALSEKARHRQSLIASRAPPNESRSLARVLQVLRSLLLSPLNEMLMKRRHEDRVRQRGISQVLQNHTLLRGGQRVAKQRLLTAAESHSCALPAYKSCRITLLQKRGG